VSSGAGIPVELEVRVVPRSSRNEIAGERDGRLLVRVTAPPVDGKANAAVCEAIAQAARVPRRHVAVVRGERSRDKRVRIENVVDERRLRASLGL
jgi:uncharacterized protein (TIGR00251 family)